MAKAQLIVLAASWILASLYCSSVCLSATGASPPAAIPAENALRVTPGVLIRENLTGDGQTTTPKVAAKNYVVRAIWKEAPLPKVHIEWRHQVEDAVPAYSGETIRFGTANFRPASGSYYLTAEWRSDGNFTRPRQPGDRFAWLGGNPLLVSSEIGGAATLALEEVPPLPSTALKGTGIFGRVTVGGVPTANVGVFAYAKADSGFKGNDFQALDRTNENGEFSLTLPPGHYYLLARLRADNSVDLGPLHKGDILGYEPGNPVVVKEGHPAIAAIPASRLKMVKHIESPDFRPGKIEGRIVDRDGRPIAGVYAALYDNLRMVGRPIFRSEPAGADGRFQLSIPVPGKYYLGARSGYGGAPTAKGWFGAWDGPADHSISIKTGELRSDLEIMVNQLP
jgi:hypothetical protein